MVKVKAKELFEKSRGNILKQVVSLRTELAQLRVAKVSGQGGATKLGQIKVVRKNIARALTIANIKTRNAVRASYQGKKAKPMDLRAKKTRAIRRALTPTEKSIKTLRQQKREFYFPVNRKIALKA